MSFRFGKIAERAFNTPLLYDERKAAAFLHGLGGRIVGDTVVIAGAEPIEHNAFKNGRPSAGRLGDKRALRYLERDQVPFAMDGSVGLIPIEGTLVHKGAWLGQASGETSYQGLQTQVQAARASSAVKGVALEIDSYGGEVSGAFETAAMIRQLSQEKPTIAILTDFAYSAGYLLASQARQIVIPEFGGAGSIGVIMVHADFSMQLAQQGVKLTIIKSGAQKAQGNPYEALPPELQQEWQTQTDAMRGAFAAAVAAGRGGRMTKAKALATEAKAYDARQALELGLVDAIADPSAAYDAFVRAINRS